MKLLRLNDPNTPAQYRMRGAQDYMCVDPRSGIYWVDIYRDDKTPKRLSRSTGVKNKDLAKKLADDMVARWLGHRPDGSTVRVTFAYAADSKLAQMEAAHAKKGKPRKGTIDNAKVYFPVLKNEFGYLYIDQINPETTWKGFVARTHLDTPGKPLYNHWKHMSLVMNYAHKCGYVDKRWDVENPDPEFREQRLLTDEEVGAIYAAAKRNLKDQMLFATTMGMRKREHLKLSWKKSHCCHVDLDQSTVTVCADHNKNSRARTIRLSPQVAAMLSRRRQGYYRHGRGRSDLWVFPSRGDLSRPVHDNKTAWNKAKITAKIAEPDNCKYHLLRHYFLSKAATRVKEGGVGLVLVCKYADVSIRTFERRYLHVTHKDTALVAGLIVVDLR